MGCIFGDVEGIEREDVKQLRILPEFVVIIDGDNEMPAGLILELHDFEVFLEGGVDFTWRHFDDFGKILSFHQVDDTGVFVLFEEHRFDGL